MYDADLFDVPVGLYTTTKNQIRQEYENRVKDLKDDDEFKENMKEMMQKASQEIDFETDISQDDSKRYAFTETLRQLSRKRTPSKVIVRARTLDGQNKYFTLSNKNNIETTIGHIRRPIRR